jgi:hypothetical protein
MRRSIRLNGPACQQQSQDDTQHHLFLSGQVFHAPSVTERLESATTLRRVGTPRRASGLWFAGKSEFTEGNEGNEGIPFFFVVTFYRNPHAFFVPESRRIESHCHWGGD